MKNPSLKSIGTNLWTFIKNLMNIRNDADIEGTTEGIKKDIDFNGINVWILICSIVIASFGLNINAVGVIIGAMLIAPLMGPILGMGLAVGTNDMATLKRSLKAFGIMTGIGLVVSWVCFAITPINTETAELLARKSPTLLDGAIAFFGGVAGIVAGSRKVKSNVVPGVAIATALMPPLCTAGYGLAIGDMGYFLGAGYLFILNSVLIAFATFLGVRYLHFPKVEFVDAATESKVKKMIAVFILSVLIPSGIILYNVTNETLFNSRSETFISEVIHFKGSEVINDKIIYTSDSTMIEVFMIGETVPEETITEWENQLPHYSLDGVELIVFQSQTVTDDMTNDMTEQVRTGIIEDLYNAQLENVKNRDEKIELLENEILKYKEDELKFNDIEREIKVNYPTIEKLSFANTFETDFTNGMDTIVTFMVNTNDEHLEIDKLSNWLEIRLKQDSVRVINY